LFKNSLIKPNSQGENTALLNGKAQGGPKITEGCIKAL
jgi:hypothetical protein